MSNYFQSIFLLQVRNICKLQMKKKVISDLKNRE